MKTTTLTARIYCGTYSKYNNGSIKGEWFDLSDYSDADELFEAFAQLHSDEDDPEYMFQDYEADNVIRSMFSESMCSDDVQKIYDAIDLIEDSYHDIEVIESAVSIFSCDIERAIQYCDEDYNGEHNSDADFAENMANELGYMDNATSWPHNCIDWDYAARELMYDYSEHNGHYFRNS